jgi:hypothetical protein
VKNCYIIYYYFVNACQLLFCCYYIMTTNENKICGGYVEASGGFGCLFNPAIKCKNITNKDKDTEGYVTKLMTKKNALDEYKQIEAFRTILENIPNFQKYFLVDNFTICEPDKLTNKDLENFEEECDTLKNKNFSTKNINQNLDKLLALNMPYGGIDVGKYLDVNVTNNVSLKQVYTELNISLINLLIHGIIPMNQIELYHCDIKGSNILVKNASTTSNKKKLQTQVIDWGLSVYQGDKDKTSEYIPHKLSKRSFHYNVPFSVILFNKKFIEKYTIFIKLNSKNGTNINYFTIREFVINYIFIWNKIRGYGHLKTINSIIKKLTYNELPAINNYKIKKHLIEYDFTYYYIIEYISKILFKYTINGELHLLDYFHNVFLKTIDIWGFVMIYIDLYEKFFDIYNYDTLNEYQTKFANKIKYIIIHFLFENPTEVINVNQLADELKEFNFIITNKHFDDKSPMDSLKNKYLTSLTIIQNDDIEEIGGGIKNKSNDKITNKRNIKTKNIRTIRRKTKKRN